MYSNMMMHLKLNASSKLFNHNIVESKVSIFRLLCLKIVNFHYLSKNRQIYVINIGSEITELCVCVFFFVIPEPL